MRLGICTSLSNLEKAAAFGYDYIEVSATALAAMDEAEFAQGLESAKASTIAVEAVNILFPKTFSLFETAQEEIEAHLELALSRAAMLGAKIAVFGSGKCRHKPASLSFGQAYGKILEALRLSGEIAAKHGITIVVEPLNRGETNMINSVAEGAILAFDAGLSNVALLADSYHMFRESESMESIITAGELAHAHVALLDGRAYPTKSDEQLEGFFAALHEIGYNDRVSVEGSTKDFDLDAPAALAVLRALGKNAQA